MNRYEFVNRKEYSLIRKEAEIIINKVQKIMKKEYDTSFQFRLIGSGKRHLITRIINGNAGYDFDYNLIIPTLPNGEEYIAKIVKEQFMLSFRKAIKGTNYSAPQDSTSAITIKVKDKVNKRVLHSLDFAIIFYEENDCDEGYYFLKNQKSQNSYYFQFRPLSVNIDQKIEYILDYENGWNEIRDEYLKLKNSNFDNNKSSFTLYLESVNNVYNWYTQD